jgi:predicted metal-dependent peptidase
VFASEMAGIVAELNPMQFICIWCDANVTRVDEVDEPGDLVELFAKWKKEGVGGGGGTDFQPAFDKIEEMGLVPDMMVFFTDGYGTFPKSEPLYPVIWASISGKSVKYPFGEVVEIEL